MLENYKNLDTLSNNELLLKIKQLQADYESVKLQMLKEYDMMIELEKIFDNATKLLTNRLKKT
jgi:hypothetical protein